MNQIGGNPIGKKFTGGGEISYQKKDPNGAVKEVKENIKI